MATRQRIGSTSARVLDQAQGGELFVTGADQVEGRSVRHESNSAERTFGVLRDSRGETSSERTVCR